MNEEELENQLEAKRRQLEKVIETSSSNIAKIDSLLLSLRTPVSPDESATKLRDKILFAISIAPNQFSLRDIEQLLKVHFPNTEFVESAVGSTFWKIVVQEKKLPIVEEGSGNRPTIYRKKINQ